MTNGLWVVEFKSASGTGKGVMILNGTRALGGDAGGDTLPMPTEFMAKLT